jgi:hypothetical protein
MQGLVELASPPDGSEVLIRPSSAGLRKVLAAIAPATTLMALGLLAWTMRSASSGGVGAAGAAAIVVVLAAFLVSYIALYLRNFSVFAGQGYFGKTDALGRRRIWPRETLDRAVLRTVNFGQGANPRYMLISTDGTPLILFSPRMFEPVATDALFRRLAVPVDARDEVLGPAELRCEFPKAVPMWAVHPRLLGLGFVLCLLAVLAVIVTGAVLSYRAH